MEHSSAHHEGACGKKGGNWATLEHDVLGTVQKHRTNFLQCTVTQITGLSDVSPTHSAKHFAGTKLFR